MTRTRALLLALTFSLPSLRAGAESQDLSWDAVEPTRQDVFYAEVAVDADGDVVSSMTSGSLEVVLDDGSPFFLDLEELEDPDGNQYYVSGGAYQEDELDPVTYTFRVTRYEPAYMTDEEAADAWSEAHPDATEADVQAFLDERAAAATPPELGISVAPSLLDWLDTADALQTTDVVLMLAEQPPLELPRAPNSLLAEEPAFWFDAMEQRLLAIEDRKTEIAAAQADFIADLEAMGGTVLETVWLHNSLSAEVPADALASLVDDPRVRSIQPPMEVELAWADHDGTDAREATQTWLYLDEGYDGTHGTGRSDEDHVYVLIVDSYLDVEHPAWDTWDAGSQSYVSRCVSAYYYEDRARDDLDGPSLADDIY